jgi:hypothetical protein
MEGDCHDHSPTHSLLDEVFGRLEKSAHPASRNGRENEVNGRIHRRLFGVILT